MLVKETVVVERELHVAPCLECGNTDILLSDSGYSSFNCGGGKCKKCGHTAQGAVSCIPSMTDLAHIWNASNDIPTMIAAERAKIEQAEKRIKELEVKAGASLYIKPFTNKDLNDLMSIEDFEEAMDRGFMSPTEGVGYWSTENGKSAFSTRQKQPTWATHVLWVSR